MINDEYFKNPEAITIWLLKSVSIKPRTGEFCQELLPSSRRVHRNVGENRRCGAPRRSPDPQPQPSESTRAASAEKFVTR